MKGALCGLSETFFKEIPKLEEIVSHVLLIRLRCFSKLYEDIINEVRLINILPYAKGLP